ncbi:MAG: choice-of-anchor P family protein [Acidimicrobiales bacterium]
MRALLSIILLPWLGAGALTPGANLGGYRASSTAAGIDVMYNDGREVDLTMPSATTSAGTGTGHALAAPVYPGPVGGNPGATFKQFLGARLPPQVADALGQLNDPLKAEAYASGPNDSSFPPGSAPQALTETAHADANGGHMKAAGTFVDVGGLASSATSVTDVAADKVVSTATSTISDLNIAGLVHIGQVSSTATATSNGTTATASGATTIAALSVAGMSIALDPAGLGLGPAKVPLDIGGVLNPVLKAIGVQLFVSPATHSVTGVKALEHAPALTIAIAPPNNGGNTFLVTVGGALAQAQATTPFSSPSPLPSVAPSVATPTPVAPFVSPLAPTGSSTVPDSAVSPTPSLPAAESIAVLPASTERSKPLPAGLVLLGLAAGAAGAFGLAKIRDDVLSEKAAGGRCPLEGSDR